MLGWAGLAATRLMTNVCVCARPCLLQGALSFKTNPGAFVGKYKVRLWLTVAALMAVTQSASIMLHRCSVLPPPPLTPDSWSSGSTWA